MRRRPLKSSSRIGREPNADQTIVIVVEGLGAYLGPDRADFLPAMISALEFPVQSLARLRAA